MEFDVGSGFSKEKVWVWRPSTRRMCRRRRDGQRHGLERRVHRSSQCRTMSLLGIAEEDLPLIRHARRVWLWENKRC